MEPLEENYLRLLSLPGTSNVHYLPWACMLVKNLSGNDLKKYDRVRDYLVDREPLWILLELVIFRDNGAFKPLLVCTHCDKMKGVKYMSLDQSIDALR